MIDLGKPAAEREEGAEAFSVGVCFHHGVTDSKMMWLTSPGLLSLKPLPTTFSPLLKQ